MDDDILELEESLNSLGGLSETEYSSQDSGDELWSEAGSQARFQFRSLVLNACWKDDFGMAEIINHKGNLLKSMGVIRNGKIYLSIEETLFLVHLGALLLVDDENTSIPLREIYRKVGEEKTGCSWIGFKVYQHLKSLGYIVGRCGIPWSLKSVRPLEDTFEKNSTSQCTAVKTPIVESLKESKLIEVHRLSEYFVRNLKMSLEKKRFVLHLPAYDVYLPNSHFKKTCPGSPNFVVYTTSGHPPSLSDIKELEKQSNGIPVKIGHVDDGRVGLFSFDKLELPVLSYV